MKTHIGKLTGNEMCNKQYFCKLFTTLFLTEYLRNDCDEVRLLLPIFHILLKIIQYSLSRNFWTRIWTRFSSFVVNEGFLHIFYNLLFLSIWNMTIKVSEIKAKKRTKLHFIGFMPLVVQLYRHINVNKNCEEHACSAIKSGRI